MATQVAWPGLAASADHCCISQLSATSRARRADMLWTRTSTTMLPIRVSPSPTDSTPVLRPTLGPWAAVMLVIGAVIGSGIFLKPSVIALSTGGYVGLILLLWLVCGLVSLQGRSPWQICPP